MPLLARFRALVPAWRFFDRAVHGPALYIRTSIDGAAELGPWELVPAGPRPAGSWLFAPAANLTLAYQATVDQLVAALGDLALEDSASGESGAQSDDRIETDPRVTSLVSYELVTRVARTYAPGAACVQWKIVVPGEPGDYIVSPVLRSPA